MDPMETPLDVCVTVYGNIQMRSKDWDDVILNINPFMNRAKNG